MTSERDPRARFSERWGRNFIILVNNRIFLKEIENYVYMIILKSLHGVLQQLLHLRFDSVKVV